MRVPSKRTDLDAGKGSQTGSSFVMGDGLMGEKGISVPSDLEDEGDGGNPGTRGQTNAARKQQVPPGGMSTADTKHTAGAHRRQLVGAVEGNAPLKGSVRSGDESNAAKEGGDAGAAASSGASKLEGKEGGVDDVVDKDGGKAKELESTEVANGKEDEGRPAGGADEQDDSKDKDKEAAEDGKAWNKGEKKEHVDKLVVEEVDMVQVDLVIRDGSYSTVRDMHTYMQGLYRKSSGRLQLWTVCNSPECGMYMLSGLKDGAMGGPRGAELAADGLNKSAGGRPGEVMPYGLIGDGMQGPSSTNPYRVTPGGSGSARFSRDRCIFLMNLVVEKRVGGSAADGSVSSDGKWPGEEAGGDGGLDADEMRPAHRISMTGNITSNNCGFSLHVNATAMNFEVYYTKAMHYTLMVTAASFMQVLLLVRQIDYSNSRSSAVKVSLLTIGQQAVMDSYLCLMHLTTGQRNNVLLLALPSGFLACCSFPGQMMLLILLLHQAVQHVFAHAHMYARLAMCTAWVCHSRCPCGCCCILRRHRGGGAL